MKQLNRRNQQKKDIANDHASTYGKVDGPAATFPEKFQDLIDAARSNPDRSLIKLKATAMRSAMGPSTVWRDVSRKTFVPPIRISTRSVAWVKVEVDALLAAKALISRSGANVNLADFVSALIST